VQQVIELIRDDDLLSSLLFSPQLLLSGSLHDLFKVFLEEAGLKGVQNTNQEISGDLALLGLLS